MQQTFEHIPVLAGPVLEAFAGLPGEGLLIDASARLDG